jgi:Polyketide cyclase / dehydrase and lipid transport
MRTAAHIAAALYRIACAIFARDVSLGRSSRALGPLTARIAAPREVVFDVIAEPYLDRTPRSLQHKLRVLDRRDDSVVAEHHTQTGRIVATTVETVRFRRPDRVEFRLVQGPVPRVAEQFDLREVESGTELDYTGELGTTLWALGRWWGGAVAERWEATVRQSLDSIKTEAERRAG